MPNPQTGQPARKQTSKSAPGRERGYVLVFLTLSLLFLFAMVGMAVDIGRMYITRAEAQSFVDSAAIAAATHLDGTSGGIIAARSAVANDPKRWGFGNDSFGTVTTQFGTSSIGPWDANPATGAGYYFVQVATVTAVPMYFIRVVAGPTSQVAAMAVSGHATTTSLRGGEFPFSPYTRTTSPNPDSATDPYGFQIGNQYTLRWGAPGTRTNCGTDNNNTLPTNGKIRGYCCVSQSAADLRASIVGGNTDFVAVGQPVPMDNGAKDTEMTAIAMRVNEDSDTTSTTYTDYLANANGNGERVVVVPVNGGGPNYINVGFAGFFLLDANFYSGLRGNQSACGEYIGAWTQGVPTPHPGGIGAFHLKLYQ